MLQPKSLEAEDLLRGDLVQVPTSAAPQGADDLGSGHWHELLLLQELGQNASPKQLVLR